MAEKYFSGSGESSDEEPDVHVCGKCKKQFTDLSKYTCHKQEKACHQPAAKSSRSTVKDGSKVDKLDGTEGAKNLQDNSDQQDTDVDGSSGDDAISVQISQGNVEVQILEPLGPQEFWEVATNDGSASNSTRVQPDHVYSKAQTEKTATKKKNKRKNSTPKTTRKRGKRNAGRQDIQIDGNIAVRIPESQLVHLMPPSSKPGKVVYRKQGAMSVFVPIYVKPVSAKTYKCSKCPAEFRSKAEQQAHLIFHKKDYKCTQCTKAFVTSDGLLRHQDRETHSHPCETCEHVFPLEVLLKKHARSHSKERAFICDVCEKGYPSESNLQSHKRNVHTAEKKHQCPECGKAFVRKDKMKRHELIHFPDTRPTFPCPFRNHLGCMKTFYREDKLKRHLFTHSAIKPYKCDVCEKTFARRDNLTDHMRIHTGLFGNPCHICNKGFQGPNRLRKHLKSAHGIVPVPPTEPLPTMVSRESATTAKTASPPPLASTGSRTPPAAATAPEPEEDSNLGSEGNDDTAEFGSSFDSDTSEEREDREQTHQLPPISKLTSRILPCTSVTPIVSASRVPRPAPTGESPSSSAARTISDIMGMSPEVLSMVRNAKNFSGPQ